MTEAERIEKAREWHAAAKMRRDHAIDKLDKEHLMSVPQAMAYHNIVDGMQDRMIMIEALFPELRR